MYISSLLRRKHTPFSLLTLSKLAYLLKYITTREKTFLRCIANNRVLYNLFLVYFNYNVEQTCLPTPHTPSEHMFAEPFKKFRSNPLKILFYKGKYRLNAKIQYIKKKRINSYIYYIYNFRSRERKLDSRET